MTGPEWQIPEARSLARCFDCGWLVTVGEWQRDGHRITGAGARELALAREPLEIEEV
jgi:hypothetical protein